MKLQAYGDLNASLKIKKHNEKTSTNIYLIENQTILWSWSQLLSHISFLLLVVDWADGKVLLTLKETCYLEVFRHLSTPLSWKIYPSFKLIVILLLLVLYAAMVHI